MILTYTLPLFWARRPSEVSVSIPACHALQGSEHMIEPANFRRIRIPGSCRRLFHSHLRATAGSIDVARLAGT